MPASRTFVPAAISSSAVGALVHRAQHLVAARLEAEVHAREARPRAAARAARARDAPASARARTSSRARRSGTLCFTRAITAASFSGLTAHGSASCRKTVFAPPRRNSSTWYDSAAARRRAPPAHRFSRRTSATAAIASTSASTSSMSRCDAFVPLYTGQNVQRFQVQLRITRTSRLCASLGGRIGPSSKPRVTSSRVSGRSSLAPLSSLTSVTPRAPAAAPSPAPP